MAKDSDKDADLFRQQLGDIRRIESDRVTLENQNKPKPPKKPRDDSMEELIDEGLDAHIETGDELLFARGGLQNRVIRKLKKGQFRYEATLDLHRMTSIEAKQALTRFIGDCKTQYIRCALVIHGKGYGSQDNKPVLKFLVAQWLRQRNDILAYASAIPAEGGTGALYILIKSQ